MNPNNKPFLNWFGYSRRERRSTFILIFILLVVVAVRYVLPSKDVDFKDISGLLASTDSLYIDSLRVKPDNPKLFGFDPNTASFDTLTILGLSEKQARTLISYRNKGGRFRKKTDIKKIYGIEEETAAILIPYIIIQTDMEMVSNFKKDVIPDQQKTERIDINISDSAAFDKLPGIGPVLSSRIIKYRKLLGGFISAAQLKEVYGLSETTYNLVVERVIADTSFIIGININNAGYKELSSHPYLERYDIQAILKYKELKGKILSISELIENKILSEVKAKKIAPYLKF
jgi:competence protein ComEA